MHRLYALEPELDAHVFFVPDDYATGREAETTRALFPRAHVHDPKTYVKFALGRPVADVPARVDLVQYLGGDLMHAARLARRLDARASTYKFSRPRYRERFARAFAVDMRNVEQLAAWRTHRDRIVLVGNLAVDGALMESTPTPDEWDDGILIMPGSRRHEIEQMIPFFFALALHVREQRPEIPVAFGLSPFTPLEDVARAVARGGDPRFYATKGRVEREGDAAFLASSDGTVRFPVVPNALAYARRARLVVIIPGTKAIELAALGAPMVACIPLNVPELIAINGPLTYLNRLPVFGSALKRAAVLSVSKRFAHATQPNLDSDEELIHELRGTLMPGHVARLVLERFDDRAWLAHSREQLRRLYRDHIGAADRMAQGVLECAG
ncbi:MAG: hypothetical protein JOZ38_12165 [Candidatus Eremiobacteraeota bacterium]|nr:hypothetical protein [Candidatus Eremiobacteraeota bacterium]